MEKRYANLALFYAIAAMAFGVFYREYTKFSHFSGQTNLSVIHTHYFLLGMFFFLVLMALEKSFSFSGKKEGKICAIAPTAATGPARFSWARWPVWPPARP